MNPSNTRSGRAAPRALGAVLALACGAAAAAAWQPRVDDTWQWQLTGKIDTRYDVDVYDIDLFDAPDAVIESLHAQGRAVVCYFSAGTAEDWRSDYDRFLPSDLGKKVDGWKGERWIDTRSANVRAIMAARIALAASRGCDGVEPDNVDGFKQHTGFALTATTQLDYNLSIAAASHAQGLRAGLKNDTYQLSDLAASFDFAVNEQCHQFKECGGYRLFTDAGKPVFNAEYSQRYRDPFSPDQPMCVQARAANLRTLVLPKKLDDSFRDSCDGS